MDIEQTDMRGIDMTPSKQDYENAYNSKVKNSEKRGIEFTLTKNEYIGLLRNRDKFVCGYSNRRFEMTKGSNHPDYPELDRIDCKKGYVKGNVIFVCRSIHALKTDYVELGKSRKGLSHDHLCKLQAIDKVLSMPTTLAKKLEPYQSLFNSIKSVENEAIKIVEDAVIKEAKKAEEVEKQKIKDKFYPHYELAQSYVKFFQMFERFGVTFQFTMKDFRDKMRRNTCTLTGVPFDNQEDKWLWIVDMTKPITPDNVVVCKKEASESFDRIRTIGGQDAIKHVVSSLANKDF